MTVEADPVRVESRLAAGQVDCPDCRGALRPWGWARPRGFTASRSCWGRAEPLRDQTVAPCPDEVASSRTARQSVRQ